MSWLPKPPSNRHDFETEVYAIHAERQARLRRFRDRGWLPSLARQVRHVTPSCLVLGIVSGLVLAAARLEPPTGRLANSAVIGWIAFGAGAGLVLALLVGLVMWRYVWSRVIPSLGPDATNGDEGSGPVQRTV
jgi:hypothetical protein